MKHVISHLHHKMPHNHHGGFRPDVPDIRHAHSATRRKHKHHRSVKVLLDNLKTIAQHPFTHHTHNIAYCVYYGIALAEDHGAIKLIIVGTLFCVSVLIAAEGHE